MRGARTDRPFSLSASVAESNYYQFNHLELISFSSWELVFAKKIFKVFLPRILVFSVFLLTSVLVEVLY